MRNITLERFPRLMCPISIVDNSICAQRKKINFFCLFGCFAVGKEFQQLNIWKPKKRTKQNVDIKSGCQHAKRGPPKRGDDSRQSRSLIYSSVKLSISSDSLGRTVARPTDVKTGQRLRKKLRSQQQQKKTSNN